MSWTRTFHLQTNDLSKCTTETFPSVFKQINHNDWINLRQRVHFYSSNFYLSKSPSHFAPIVPSKPFQLVGFIAVAGLYFEHKPIILEATADTQNTDLEEKNT